MANSALSRDPADHMGCDPAHCDVARSNATDGFHAQENWFFKRLEGGMVRVTSASEPPRSVLLEASVWASVVASVSADGETGETYRAALAFHGEDDT